MDAMILTIILRALERIIVVVSGALSIYLGYRLFLVNPERDESTGKFKLPGGISIYMTRVGPGVFFTLFGAAVIAFSLKQGIEYSENITSSLLQNQKAWETLTSEPSKQRRYSGVGPVPEGKEPSISGEERNDILHTVRKLNEFVSDIPASLSPAKQIDYSSAVEKAKVCLMQEAWDLDKWGEFSQFNIWLQGGGQSPPADSISEPVRYFREGSKQ